MSPVTSSYRTKLSALIGFFLGIGGGATGPRRSVGVGRRAAREQVPVGAGVLHAAAERGPRPEPPQVGRQGGVPAERADPARVEQGRRGGAVGEAERLAGGPLA